MAGAYVLHPRDAELAKKCAKVGMFGKGVTADLYDEADACLRAAEAIMAHEQEEEAAASPGCFLHEAVVKSLQRELDDVRSKLMHHSTHREMLLEAEVRELRTKVKALEARAHWEGAYAWTLPGAFILASDRENGGNDCDCRRERRLYGGDRAAAGALHRGSGGETAVASGGRTVGAAGGVGVGAVCVRTCACGNRY
jgi:hypothetical protein